MELKKKVEPSDLYYVGNVTLLKLFKRTNIIFEEGRKGGGGKKMYHVKKKKVDELDENESVRKKYLYVFEFKMCYYFIISSTIFNSIY